MYRQTENKLHDMLHGNLSLLILNYPPSKEFFKHFRRDMFVKTNKAGFFEVVYYLLNILDPVLTEQQLPSWPPYDIKRENKFRLELIKYITYINASYKQADIPVMMASHFVSPHGQKIVKFLLKLSQLVMFRSLSTNHPEMLMLLSTTKNKTNMKLVQESLSAEIEKNNSEAREITVNFYKDLNTAKEEANVMIKQDKELDELLREERIKNENLKKLSVNEVSSVVLLQSKFQDNIPIINNICETFKKLQVQQQNLLSENRILRHDQQTVKVLIDKNEQDLNLKIYFHSLAVLLEKRIDAMNMPLHMNILKSNIDKENKMLEKYIRNVNVKIDVLKNSNSYISKLFSENSSLTSN